LYQTNKYKETIEELNKIEDYVNQSMDAVYSKYTSKINKQMNMYDLYAN